MSPPKVEAVPLLGVRGSPKSSSSSTIEFLIVDSTSRVQSRPRRTCSCQEEDCDEVFVNVQQLRAHLENKHHIAQPCEQFFFGNFIEFEEWKNTLEEKKNAKWVVVKGPHTSKSGKKSQTFYCCRSGKQRTRGNGIRRMKSQGSRKIENYCTSTIAYVEQKDGPVKVKYYPTHYGHDNRLGHIPLPQRTKEEVAERLSQGEDPRKVLADVRLSGNGEIGRNSLITYKDIHNIKFTKGIKFDSRTRIDHVHQSVVTSVEEWIASSGRENIVLFYKRQGDEDRAFKILKEQDFILIIMTPFQCQLFKEYGNDRICLDTTHGSKECDYELTTLLVANRFEEAVPVAFCLSSSVDFLIIKSFLLAVKEKVGIVKCNLFMSVEDKFHDAWSEVMECPRHYLMCAWHIDRAWQQNMTLIAEKNKRQAVASRLRACQLQVNNAKFHSMFSSLLNELEIDRSTFLFASYLNEHFADRCHLWAYCYRIGLNVNTNVHVEGFHRVLKQHYRLKRGTQVEHYISTLSEYLVDKEFDEYTRDHKGKVTKKLARISVRHGKGVEMVDHVLASRGRSWLVVSSTENGIHDIVTPVDGHECNSCCPVKCEDCPACLGSLICSCHDNAVKGNLCEHIHAVALYNRRCTLESDDENVSSSDEIRVDPSPQSTVQELRTWFRRVRDKVLYDDFTLPSSSIGEVTSHLGAVAELIGLQSDDVMDVTDT